MIISPFQESTNSNRLDSFSDFLVFKCADLIMLIRFNSIEIKSLRIIQPIKISKEDPLRNPEWIWVKIKCFLIYTFGSSHNFYDLFKFFICGFSLFRIDCLRIQSRKSIELKKLYCTHRYLSKYL